MATTKIEKLLVSKQKLTSIPKDEQEFIIYAGHILNELNWLNKTIWSTHCAGEKFLGRELDENERAQFDGYTAQKLMLKRFAAGKSYEAVKYLKTRVIKKAWFRRAIRKISPKGKKNWKSLKRAMKLDYKQFRKNPLWVARQWFAFHYHPEQAIEACTDHKNIPDEFVYYLGDNMGNSLHMGSELTVTTAFADLISMKRATVRSSLNRFIPMLLNRLHWLTQVYGELLGVLITEERRLKKGGPLETIGQTLKQFNSKTLRFEDLPAIKDLEFPWFTRVV